MQLKHTQHRMSQEQKSETSTPPRKCWSPIMQEHHNLVFVTRCTTRHIKHNLVEVSILASLGSTSLGEVQLIEQEETESEPSVLQHLPTQSAVFLRILWQVLADLRSGDDVDCRSDLALLHRLEGLLKTCLGGLDRDRGGSRLFGWFCFRLRIVALVRGALFCFAAVLFPLCFELLLKDCALQGSWDLLVC